MNEQQFENARTTAGLWFAVQYLEEISKREMELRDAAKKKVYIEQLYQKLHKEGRDKNINGTKTRVYAVLRIIRGGDAWMIKLLKIGATSAKASPETMKSACRQLKARGIPESQWANG